MPRNLSFSMLLVVLLGGIASAGEPPARTFPFTAADDADGARFVWFIYGRTGLEYPYVPAKDLPRSPRFERVPRGKGQAGDVAWWPAFVALYDPSTPNGELMTARGKQSLAKLEAKYGPVTFFQFVKPQP